MIKPKLINSLLIAVASVVCGSFLLSQAFGIISYAENSSSTEAKLISQRKNGPSTNFKSGGSIVATYVYSVDSKEYNYEAVVSSLEPVPATLTIAYDNSNPSSAEHLVSNDSLSERKNDLILWSALIFIAGLSGAGLYYKFGK